MSNYEDKQIERPEIVSVVRALEAILELGRKDLSNPKYDDYFAHAWAALIGYHGTKPVSEAGGSAQSEAP